MFIIKRPFPKHFFIIICTQNIKEKTQQGHVCDEYIPVQAVETFVVASMFPIWPTYSVSFSTILWAAFLEF